MIAVTRRWTHSQLYEWLRLKGYVAFDVPRTVTVLGTALLFGIVAVHVYVLATQAILPVYFTAYTVVMMGCCLLTAALLWVSRNPVLPQWVWFFGDVVSLVFLGIYLASRTVTLPGLVAVTGRWDFAPGTFAGVFALGFMAVHMSVLLGINVAYPQRQQWSD